MVVVVGEVRRVESEKRLEGEVGEDWVYGGVTGKDWVWIWVHWKWWECEEEEKVAWKCYVMRLYIVLVLVYSSFENVNREWVL